MHLFKKTGYYFYFYMNYGNIKSSRKTIGNKVNYLYFSKVLSLNNNLMYILKVLRMTWMLLLVCRCNYSRANALCPWPSLGKATWGWSDSGQIQAKSLFLLNPEAAWWITSKKISLEKSLTSGKRDASDITWLENF